MADMDWRLVEAAQDGTTRDDQMSVDFDYPAAELHRILSISSFPPAYGDGGPEEVGTPPLTPGTMTVSAVKWRPNGDSWPEGEAYEYRTSTKLDFYVVVDGELVVGLDTGEVTLTAGDVLVDRGAHQRMRAGGDRPARVVVTHIDPAPTATPPADLPVVELKVGGESGEAQRVRRVVLGSDENGRSVVVVDGDPPVGTVVGDADAPAVALTDVWQTGGLVTAGDQGGDPESWAFEPLGCGVKVMNIEMAPSDAPTDGPADDVFHITPTISVAAVISGEAEWSFPDQPPARLTAGDLLVVRGTPHQTRALGDTPLRLVLVMVGAR